MPSEYMQCCLTLSCVLCHVVFDLALLFKAHCSEASFDSRAGGLDKFLSIAIQPKDGDYKSKGGNSGGGNIDPVDDDLPF